jgi:hypothetical protein
VRSASGGSGIDAIDSHEVFRNPSVVVIPIRAMSRELLHGCGSTASITAPVYVQSVGNLHSLVPYVLHFLSHGDIPPIAETHQRLDDVN